MTSIFGKVSGDEVKVSEERALPVTLLCYCWLSGGLWPAFAAGNWRVLSISMALGGLRDRALLHLSILVQNLATMLGLWLGHRHALL